MAVWQRPKRGLLGHHREAPLGTFLLEISRVNNTQWAKQRKPENRAGEGEKVRERERERETGLGREGGREGLEAIGSRIYLLLGPCDERGRSYCINKVLTSQWPGQV